MIKNSKYILLLPFLFYQCTMSGTSVKPINFKLENGATGKLEIFGDKKSTFFKAVLNNAIPGEVYILNLNGGTCNSLSASFTTLGKVMIGESGKAEVSGEVLYRDIEPIAFENLISDAFSITIGNEAATGCYSLTFR